MTSLLAPSDLSHISGMVRPILPHYWHHVTIPTLVEWYGHYYHITGTVWHFPQQWHDTASMTKLLALCDLSYISGIVHPILPHYWHSVTFPTLVAWYSQYYHITGTV